MNLDTPTLTLLADVSKAGSVSRWDRLRQALSITQFPDSTT